MKGDFTVILLISWVFGYSFFQRAKLIPKDVFDSSSFHFSLFFPNIPSFPSLSFSHSSSIPIFHYSHLFHFNLVVGSPNNIHVLRTSMSFVAALAFIVASPRVRDLPSNSRGINFLFIRDWPSGTVNPDEAQTAIAPPCSAFKSDSARLSVGKGA